MSKKIFFDGLNLGLKQGTGVATYTRVLANMTRDMGNTTGILHSRPSKLSKDALSAEVAFFDEDDGNRQPAAFKTVARGLDHLVGLFGTRPQKLAQSGAVLTRAIGNRWVPCDYLYSGKNIFRRAAVSFAAFGYFYRVKLSSPSDIFHWTYPIPMRAHSGANIYTIHDLVPMRLPYTTLDHKRYYLRLMKKIGKTADHIITVSEHSKRDIVKYLGVDEKRVTNTYQALDIPEIYRTRPLDEVANDLTGIFGLEMRKYFLFYGALEPKKNIARLIQAYLAANIDMPLVVVLSRSWISENESRLMEQIISEDDREHKERVHRKIRRYDYLSFPLLMTLIRGARGIVFPSLYEGFGLPVLEAMSLGTPVLTSTESSLPEVAGDAALSVDPYNMEAIRKGISALASDDDLCADLSKRGLEQAQKFSMEKYRGRMASLYASIS
jgi:glycosyltransferase involved in cell wall biosynthesis